MTQKYKEPQITEELRKLLERAENGDADTLPELRELLDANPELWREHGDLARLAERSQIALMMETNLLLHESVARMVAELRTELGYETASRLERLLIERITACWLQVHHADFMSQTKGITLIQGDYAQRRQDRAHRRYLSAIRSLALVRRLLRPASQPKASTSTQHSRCRARPLDVLRRELAMAD